MNAPAETSQPEVAGPQQMEPASELQDAILEIRKSLAKIDSDIAALRKDMKHSEEELLCFQEGYDWAKRKELLVEYRNWLDYLGEQEASLSGDAREEMTILRETMEVTMENFSLESFRPHVGVEFAPCSRRAEIVGTDDTDDEAKNGKIAKVVRSGILYRRGEGPDGIKVIRRAQVKIWRRVDTPRKDHAERNQSFAAPRKKRPVGPQSR